MLSVALPNNDLIEYLVDGMGRRVGKKKNGVLLKQWLYRDALKPVAELDAAGNRVAQFVYGSKPNVPDYVVRGTATYRVVSDLIGEGPVSAFVVFAGCEVYAITGLLMDLNNFNVIQDQLNEVRRQRDAVDREIARQLGCGEDTTDQLARRQFLDDEMARLAKDLAKFSPWGDFLAKEFVCIPLTLGAGLVKALP